MEFSLSEIIALLMKRFVFIAVSIFMGLCIFFVINTKIMKPTFTASLQMYVNQNDTTSSGELNELYYAQKVVTTYINFLQTKTFYKQVREECGLNYSINQIEGMTAIRAVDNTEIFQISVTSNSPEDSYQIVAAMQEIAPVLIKSIKYTAQISVVDPVVLPSAPSGPNVLMNTFVGGLLGLLLSIIASFLWETININVKNQEDLKKKYDMPILGVIPNYKIFKRRIYRLLNIIPFLRKKIKIKQTKSSIQEDSTFMINEAYDSLRTNLRFTLRKDGCKKLIINSPTPEDGKSTTSANIAVKIARAGAKVILLDCDLRKGTLHNIFNIKNAPGMSDALSGMVSEKDVIQNTKYENLQLISMGAIPPNPNELLGSIQMEELLKKLDKIYDYIIIDSPPVNVVSDALSLIKLVDGVLVVVREGITTHPNIESAITKYKFSEANILGFVINGVYINQGNKSKSQYYYYRQQSK